MEPRRTAGNTGVRRLGLEHPRLTAMEPRRDGGEHDPGKPPALHAHFTAMEPAGTTGNTWWRRLLRLRPVPTAMEPRRDGGEHWVRSGWEPPPPPYRNGAPPGRRGTLGAQRVRQRHRITAMEPRRDGGEHWVRSGWEPPPPPYRNGAPPGRRGTLGAQRVRQRHRITAMEPRRDGGEPAPGCSPRPGMSTNRNGAPPGRRGTLGSVRLGTSTAALPQWSPAGTAGNTCTLRPARSSLAITPQWSPAVPAGNARSSAPRPLCCPNDRNGAPPFRRGTPLHHIGWSDLRYRNGASLGRRGTRDNSQAAWRQMVLFCWCVGVTVKLSRSA